MLPIGNQVSVIAAVQGGLFLLDPYEAVTQVTCGSLSCTVSMSATVEESSKSKRCYLHVNVYIYLHAYRIIYPHQIIFFQYVMMYVIMHVIMQSHAMNIIDSSLINEH